MPSLAISTTFIGYDDLIPHLPALAEHGIENIELRGYLPRLDYTDQEYLSRLKDELTRHRLSVSSYHLPFHACYLSAAEETARKEAVATMLDSVEAAVFLNARCVVLHPGGAYKNESEKIQGQAQSLKSIEEILRVTEAANMPLALENMLPHRIGEDVEWLLLVLERLRPRLAGVCFDTSHANVLGADLEQSIEMLGPRIINVHFSDNQGKKDEHLFPFLGKIAWEKVLGALKKIGYAQPFTLEVHQCDNLENMLSEALSCQQKLQEIWERI